MKDSKEMSLLDVANDLDCTICELEEILDAFHVLYERLEEEGFQGEDDFEEWKAINFAKRFPMYLSTFSVITNGLRRAADDLEKETEQIYAAHQAQKSGVA